MKITWGINDGYVGGSSRTHSTIINDDDLDECESEQEREALITDAIQEDFSQRVSWYEVSRK